MAEFDDGKDAGALRTIGELGEALGTEGALRGAEALTVVDRDLAPLTVGVARRVVALAGTALLGLLLGPRSQLEDLLGHRAHRDVDEGALVVGDAGPDAVQAGVIGAPLEDGVRRVEAGHALDRLHEPREVALDELVLEGEGGGGDHDALVVEHRRDEVAQRLAGAGAGLDEQVLLGLQRLGDRLGHRHLAGSLLAAERLDGGRQHLADRRPHASGGDVRWHSRTLCRGVDTRRTACTAGPVAGARAPSSTTGATNP